MSVADPLFGPPGDPSRHVPRADLEAALAGLPLAPRDAGHVALIVCRRADKVRETPERVHLHPGTGIPGDGWGRKETPDPEAEITIMQLDVAELIANGQPVTVFGDNLLVDLDLSTGNLPTGSRVRIGGATLEVTAKPHNGCRKFAARFGQQALRFVAARELRHRNLRGIHLRVVEPGDVAVGDRIDVLSR